MSSAAWAIKLCFSTPCNAIVHCSHPSSTHSSAQPILVKFPHLDTIQTLHSSIQHWLGGGCGSSLPLIITFTHLLEVMSPHIPLFHFQAATYSITSENVYLKLFKSHFYLLEIYFPVHYVWLWRISIRVKKKSSKRSKWVSHQNMALIARVITFLLSSLPVTMAPEQKYSSTKSLPGYFWFTAFGSRDNIWSSHIL